MNIFDELAENYYQLDGQYAAKELEARAKQHIIKEAHYQRKRDLNDQAYFLFMFTRMEERIKELSKRLLDQKNNSITNYKNKRAWQMIKSRADGDKISLMEHVSFFTAINGADYNLLFIYKRQRDRIAHGDTVQAINMTNVLNNFKRLYAQLNN